MNTDYIAKTLIQKPDGYYVIGYLGKEPIPELTYDSKYQNAIGLWRASAKYFHVKPEDVQAFKDALNGPMKLKNAGKSDIDEILYDGYNIESIADRVVFKYTRYVAMTNKGPDVQHKYRAYLKPEDKPVEESQDEYYKDLFEMMTVCDLQLPEFLKERLKEKFTITRKTK